MRRRGSLIPRGDSFGARVYIDGAYTWLGTHATEEQAQKAIDAALETGEAPSLETVADFARRWVADYPRPRISSNETNRYRAKRIAEITETVQVGKRRVLLSRTRLRDVTRPMARAFAMANPGLLAACRAMFSDAVDDGLVETNPFANLRLAQSRGRADIEPLTIEEVDLLGDLAIEEFGPRYGPTFRAAVYVAAYTMIRPGELFGLEWPDVNRQEGTLFVRRRVWRKDVDLPKGKRAREIVLPDETLEPLGLVPRRTDTARIFSTRRGKQFSQPNFVPYWHKLRARFEGRLPAARARQLREARSDKGDMDFYELRHFGASHMLDQGISPADVAFQMGHTDSLLVERRYGHPSDRLTRQRIRQGLRQNVQELRVVSDAASDAEGG